MSLIVNPFGEEKTDDEVPTFIQAPVPTINPWVNTNNNKKNTPTMSRGGSVANGVALFIRQRHRPQRRPDVFMKNPKK